MKKIKETIKAFLAIPFVKYGVVLVIGVVLIGFVGSNSIWGHFRNKMRISELKESIVVTRPRFISCRVIQKQWKKWLVSASL